MNAIQEISLKLQLGIDPSSGISPLELRTMWSQVSEDRFGAAWKLRKEAPGLFKTAQMATRRRKR